VEKKDRNVLKERFNSTKPLDDLKEQEIKLQCQKEEELVVIQDENTMPFAREAAEAQFAEINDDQMRLQTHIEE